MTKDEIQAVANEMACMGCFSEQQARTVAIGLIGSIINLDDNGAGSLALGGSATVSDEFDRPTNTDNYGANDAVSATTSDSGTTPLRPLVNIARAAGTGGIISKLRVRTSKVSVTARIRVHFYSVAQPASSVPGDNAPMPIMFANRAQRLGAVDLPGMTSGVAGSDDSGSMIEDQILSFVTADGDRNLYYRLETLDAITNPNSGQRWFIEVTAQHS